MPGYPRARFRHLAAAGFSPVSHRGLCRVPDPLPSRSALRLRTVSRSEGRGILASLEQLQTEVGQLLGRQEFRCSRDEPEGKKIRLIGPPSGGEETLEHWKAVERSLVARYALMASASQHGFCRAGC